MDETLAHMDRVDAIALTGRFRDAADSAALLKRTVSESTALPEYLNTDATWRLEAFEEASRWPEARRDSLAHSYVLLAAADSLCDQLELTSATDHVERALSIRRRLFLDGHPLVLEVFSSKVSLLASSNHGRQASSVAQQTYEGCLLALGEGHPMTAMALSNLAECHRQSDRLNSAEVLSRAAYEQLKQTSHPKRVIALYVLASVLLGQNRDVEAAPMFRRCIELSEAEQPQRSVELAAFYNAYGLATTDPRESVSALQRALSLLDPLPDPGIHAVLLQNLGKAQTDAGDNQAAAETLRRALELADSTGSRSSPNLQNLAVHLFDALVFCGRQEEADEVLYPEIDRVVRRFGRNSLAIVAPLKRRGLRELARGSFASAESTFAWAARVYAQEGSDGESTYHDARFTEAPHDALALARLFQGQHDAAWEAHEAGLARSLLKTWKGARSRAPLTAVQVRGVLKPDEAVVGWIRINVPKRHGNWAYVIRRDAPVIWEPVRGHGQPAPLEELLSSRDAPAAKLRDATLAALSLTIDPVIRHLHGVRTVIVVPFAARGWVDSPPFTCLADSTGAFLGDRSAFCYTPSVTALYLCRKRPGVSVPRDAGPALFVADPKYSALDPDVFGPESVDVPRFERLSQAKREADEISAFFSDALVLAQTEADEQVLKDRWSGDFTRFRVLHFAAHATPSATNVNESRIHLSRRPSSTRLHEAVAGADVFDGDIASGEITGQWKLNADLVVLSACRTAVGPYLNGEGHVGFGHAFLAVGAKSVVLTRWAIDDYATNLLMKEFYRYWIYGDGTRSLSKAEALRRAQLWLRDYEDPSGERVYSSPYYWGGFVLVGDPE